MPTALEKVAISSTVIVGVAVSGLGAAGTILALHCTPALTVALPLFAKMGAVTAMVGLPTSAIPLVAGIGVLLASLTLTILATLVVAALTQSPKLLYNQDTVLTEQEQLQAALNSFHDICGLDRRTPICISSLEKTESGSVTVQLQYNNQTVEFSVSFLPGLQELEFTDTKNNSFHIAQYRAECHRDREEQEECFLSCFRRPDQVW